MLDIMFLYLPFGTFHVMSLFFQDELAVFVNIRPSILIMSDIIQKCAEHTGRILGQRSYM